MECTNFILWDPSIPQKPAKPTLMGKYTPLFPIYAVSVEGRRKIVWYWVWECTICHNERVMTRTTVLYDNCTCVDKKHKLPKYPLLVERQCAACKKMFTYNMTSTGHIVRYCSDECRLLAKKNFKRATLLDSVDKLFIKQFNRSVVCTRVDGTYKRLCANYHVCATYRTSGVIGPHYNKGGVCFVSSDGV